MSKRPTEQKMVLPGVAFLIFWPGDHRLCTVNSNVRLPTRCRLSATCNVTL